VKGTDGKRGGNERKNTRLCVVLCLKAITGSGCGRVFGECLWEPSA